MPGWAWMILGILLTIVVILLMPKLLKSDGDGFFRPQPNPDAQPAPVVADGGVVVPDSGNAKPAPAADEGPKYDFYTLLPGKEVAVSDAELAATERAETQRAEAQRAAAALRGETPPPAPVRSPDAADLALPSPVTDEPAARARAQTPTPAPTAVATAPAPAPAAVATQPVAPAADGSRYLLQAGAFQASGQAEELKARLAMMGLSARVEPAEINGSTVYRVRMGPYGSAGDLADAKRKLASSGVSAMAIKAQ